MGAQGLSAKELGRRFIDAVNRRDGDALVAVCDPEVEFLPTMLVGTRAIYHGHEGLRQWLGTLIAAGAEHEVRVREVRRVGVDRFAVLTELLLDGELLSPSALIATRATA